MTNLFHLPVVAVPYMRLPKRLLLGRGSLRDVAYREDVLCPEETTTFPPSIYLPNQIEKIKDFKPMGRWDHAMSMKELIEESVTTNITFAPTTAYHIKDAVLVDGSIYKRNYRYPLADRSLFSYPALVKEPRRIKSGALVSTYLGTRFFGHWLADDCTKYLLAEQFGSPVCVRRPASWSNYSHMKEYEVFFNQNMTPVDRTQIDHLVVFDDASQNSLKRKRYEILRERIAARFPGDGHQTYVYLRRGQTGVPRLIENEQEIIDTLVQRNFIVVDVMDSDSLEKIIQLLVNAKLVVSLEGSHVYHCMAALRKTSGILLLQPPDRFLSGISSWSRCIGIRSGFVVGGGGDGNYYFSICEILATVDLVLASLEKGSVESV